MKQVKVAIIGDGGCGKTTFVTYLKTKYFEKKYVPTIGVDVVPYLVPDTNIALNFWDTAGQDKFALGRDLYCKQAGIILAMYSLDIKKSFMKVVKEVNYLKEKYGINVPVIMVGTKSDLYNAPIPQGLNVISSKLGTGFDEVINKIVEKIN